MPWYETPGDEVWITHSAPISSSTDCRILPWYFDAASSWCPGWYVTRATGKPRASRMEGLRSTVLVA